MAKEHNEIDELALSLYAERISKLPAQSSGEEAARWAFRKAEDFLAIRDRLRSGEKEVLHVSKLADVAAPNLKKTHPHNLVSQRFADENGGEAKVLAMIREIHNWLIAHPKSDQSEVAYDKLDWDVPTTNLARVLLPHYVN